MQVTLERSVDPAQLVGRYKNARAFTERLTQPLLPEDMVIQSMPDASPTRWHLAHTTWFFETFVLKKCLPEYCSKQPAFEFLFNSYYNRVGPQFPRHRRGLLSRPSVAEVFDYRREVDAALGELLHSFDESAEGMREILDHVELGIHHEQQHQELILTDVKHALSCNPLHPVYRRGAVRPIAAHQAPRWFGFEEGIYPIGHDGREFCFDNEFPRHRQFVHSFQMADRLVTNGEFLEFIQADGYKRPDAWLSAGWANVQAEGWTAPLYWERQGAQWLVFTLAGLLPVEPAAPVCHISYFEADAYARWAGARLPTEAEWEVAAANLPMDGNFAESAEFHPCPARGSPGQLRQMFGDVWEWTGSAYLAYPGFRPAPGAIGEYNGKFMCNQMVLRGGSCVTPRTHIRATYRNFFPPAVRWQFAGVRLARDAS